METSCDCDFASDSLCRVLLVSVGLRWLGSQEIAKVSVSSADNSDRNGVARCELDKYQHPMGNWTFQKLKELTIFGWGDLLVWGEERQ